MERERDDECIWRLGGESSLWVGIRGVRIGVSLQVEEAVIADIVVAENGAIESSGRLFCSRVRRRGVVELVREHGTEVLVGGVLEYHFLGQMVVERH
ncbi:hypothetical protein LOK49_LG14G01168 [Camellia lanceoleosa]|uniref:Uncharacterized protein n=1 Tax=Camellia lanceoleosa TaxID=1840588 RepID=A0ACC0FBV7_9ERIC|nr:hypothetical protein LOK49_LG14G01168 [Camellia lanceoleosa]